jgi:hypothetical protein
LRGHEANRGGKRRDRTDAVLIDRFAPTYDFTEVHRIEIAAPAGAVYEALWTTDIASSWIIRALVTLRSLPKRLSGASTPEEPASLRLEALLRSGFGKRTGSSSGRSAAGSAF